MNRYYVKLEVSTAVGPRWDTHHVWAHTLVEAVSQALNDTVYMNPEVVEVGKMDSSNVLRHEDVVRLVNEMVEAS